MQGRAFEVSLRPVAGVPGELHGQHAYTRATGVYSSAFERYVHLDGAPRRRWRGHPIRRHNRTGAPVDTRSCANHIETRGIAPAAPGRQAVGGQVAGVTRTRASLLATTPSPEERPRRRRQPGRVAADPGAPRRARHVPTPGAGAEESPSAGAAAIYPKPFPGVQAGG
jgi:hypothetical protein